MLNDEQERALTSGGDCSLHHHLDDRSPHRDDSMRLRELEKQQAISGAANASYNIDLYLCNTTSAGFTLTLPKIKLGQRFYVVKMVAGNTLTIAAASGETINGAATLALTAVGMRYLKATVGGWYTLP